MNTKKCILGSTLLLAVGFTMFASSQPSAPSENRAQALARLAEISAAMTTLATEKAREIKTAYDARIRAGAMVQQRICQRFLTVREVSTNVTPHLRVEDVVLLIGPMPFSGVYQVTPVGGIHGPGWDHPWTQGHYFATPIPLQADNYEVHGVWVGPHNGLDARDHDYTMQVTEKDENNCATSAIFKGERHVGAPTALDPGHAVLD